MKGSLLLLFVVGSLVVNTAGAQFNRGRWLADGTMSASNSTSQIYNSGSGWDTRHNTEFNFAPTVGYFVIDNLATGLQLSTGIRKDNYDIIDANTGTVYNAVGHETYLTAGPFVRYYLPVAIFFHASATMGVRTYRSKAGPNEGEIKQQNHRWSLAMGYAWFLNDYVAIEPSLGYQSSGSKYRDSETRTKYGTAALNIGLSIYLGERK